MTIEPVVDDTSDLDGPAPRGIIPFGPPAPPPPPTPLVQPVSEYDMPADCMYGWLGEQTRKLEAPPGIAYCSMLAIFSGQGIPMDKRTGTRGQIYVVATASPGKGKSHTMTRAKRSLIVRPGVIRSANPGSDIGLQHILALEPEEGAPKGTPQPVNYCLLHADELKGLIGRLSIQNSGLGTMLTDMWDNDIYETATAKGKITTNARFSLLGGVACRDQDDFAALFGEGTMGGLYDRMIVVPQAEAWEWGDNWEPTLVERHPWPVTIPPSATTAIGDWARATKAAILARDPESSAHELVGRIAANARRVALISASANNESIMSDACVQAALHFADWQLKVKTKFQSSGCSNDDSTARLILLQAFKKQAERDVAKYKEFGRNMYHSYGDLYRSSNLRRYEAKLGPGIFNRCWQAMVSLEILEREPICGEDGEPKPNLFTKRCRLAN